MEDKVIPDVMNHVLISILEVCQERGGVKKGGTWRTLGVPDRRHGGQGH